MRFEIEYLYLDTNPLLASKEKKLASFLAPLHDYNQVLKGDLMYGNQRKTYYLHGVGQLNMKNNALKTYFKVSDRSLKLNEIICKSSNTNESEPICKVFDYNNFTKSLSSESFGVVNRLKIGFNLNLINESKKVDIFKTLNEIVSMKAFVCRNNNESNILSLGKLYEDVLSKSTRDHSTERELEKKTIGSKDIGSGSKGDNSEVSLSNLKTDHSKNPNCKFYDKVAVLTGNNKEIASFESNLNNKESFYVQLNGRTVEVHYFDYIHKDKGVSHPQGIIRVYVFSTESKEGVGKKTEIEERKLRNLIFDYFMNLHVLYNMANNYSLFKVAKLKAKITAKENGKTKDMLSLTEKVKRFFTEKFEKKDSADHKEKWPKQVLYTTSKQKQFLKEIVENMNRFDKDREYGYLNFGKDDEGKFLDIKKRNVVNSFIVNTKIRAFGLMLS